VAPHLQPYFPQLVSYTRFVELMPQALIPLCGYLRTRKGRCTGIAFIDSTALAVCHNRRLATHKVFKGWAARGKTSMGWFYGFKLHLIVNDEGELLAFQLTPGHVDDRRPVPRLAKGLLGQLFGDRGYISQVLHDVLWGQGLELLTKVRRNMKNRLMRLEDKLLLRKRALIETINIITGHNVGQNHQVKYRPGGHVDARGPGCRSSNDKKGRWRRDERHSTPPSLQLLAGSEVR
jgi:hypothetical protein